MDIKIFIDNPLLRFSKKGVSKETQLVSDTVIRFEVDGRTYKVSADPVKKGLCIRQTEGLGSLSIEPISSNFIAIK